ncbi:hypothetical protein DLAC_11584 [Tieghemostelium lacteum]|uniref:Uncharacterized protein n=1 Tax=Tieghemostelium lacteum TaxID=361077 RepID=A0A151ZJD4_TIELA|nr:hypothetical protein DLAC_11584 [Tieghemostelium lacteum]|eukprot:KYQ94093.1 hypothetical protein DLAC_11584 [Tieghemostelium lacteum]
MYTLTDRFKLPYLSTLKLWEYEELSATNLNLLTKNILNLVRICENLQNVILESFSLQSTIKILSMKSNLKKLTISILKSISDDEMVDNDEDLAIQIIDLIKYHKSLSCISLGSMQCSWSNYKIYFEILTNNHYISSLSFHQNPNMECSIEQLKLFDNLFQSNHSITHLHVRDPHLISILSKYLIKTIK